MLQVALLSWEPQACPRTRSIPKHCTLLSCDTGTAVFLAGVTLKERVLPDPSRFPLNRFRVPSLLFLVLICVSALADAQTAVNIHRIQSFLPNSPMFGKLVTTEGIVTVVLRDGFYIENSYETHWCLDPKLLNCWDNDVTTAEGIFVQTNGVPDPAYATVGALVTVTGNVVHSNTSADPAAVGLEIKATETPSRVDNTTHALPPTIAASVFASARTGVFGQWLEFSGMQVEIASLTTTSGTGGTVAKATQTATSNGQFWGVMTSKSGPTTRPVRAAGISVLEPVPAGAPSSIARWSGNPSLLLIDSTTRGGPALDVTANETISNLVGIVDYHESALGYTAILLDPANGHGAIAASPAAGGTPVAAGTSVQATIATLNLDGFFDSPVVDANGFATRVDKTALAVVHFLNSPDILALQQAASTAALNALASQIVADGGPAYKPCWFPGNDSTGLANGFLVNESRVDVSSCAAVDGDKGFKGPDGNGTKLFDRPPLVLIAGLKRGPIADYAITVINSELAERTEIDDPAAGPTVRARRAAQAEDLSAIVQSYQSMGKHVVALGDFHSFEFSDGFVDTMGAVAGAPSPANAVTLPASTVTSPPMVNLTTMAATPAEDRYTFAENGSAEQADHILVSAEFAGMASLSYARFGADFPAVDLNDNTTALHASSHDGIVAYLSIPQGGQFALTSSVNPSFFGQEVVFTAALSGAAGIPTGTVTFSDGGTTLCASQPMSDGTATCATRTLALGGHSIKADYSGDAAYVPETATLTQAVNPDPGFSMNIAPTGKSVYTGEAAAYLVTVAPETGFALDVALSCSGLPAGTTCSFSPSTIRGGSGIAQLVVKTSPPVNTAGLSIRKIGGRSFPLTAALLLLFIPATRRRGGRWFILALLSFAAAGAIIGCGSSGTLVGGTPPATYTITVTGDAIGSYAPVAEAATTTITVKSLF